MCENFIALAFINEEPACGRSISVPMGPYKNYMGKKRLLTYGVRKLYIGDGMRTGSLPLLFYGAVGEGTHGGTLWVFIILRGHPHFLEVSAMLWKCQKTREIISREVLYLRGCRLGRRCTPKGSIHCGSRYCGSGPSQ